MHADVAQLVEHHLAKVGVAGSSPVVRSRSEAVSRVQGSSSGDTLGDTSKSEQGRPPVVGEAHSTLGHLSQSVDANIVKPWDGASLTLFGVLYGIVATALGVVVAVVWPSWWAVVIYAVSVLVVVAVALMFYGQPIITAMGWLVERGKRVPPGPFNRRWH